MSETYWIYTNDGRKVGKFEIDLVSMVMSFMTEDQYIACKFRKACERMSIDPAAHNFCIAAA